MNEGDQRRLSSLRRKLKNAKTRALYWSGNPSFAQNRFSPSRVRHSASEGYEFAMCDIHSLRQAIFEISGVWPKDYDPKAAFRKAFSKVILPAIRNGG